LNFEKLTYFGRKIAIFQKYFFKSSKIPPKSLHFGAFSSTQSLPKFSRLHLNEKKCKKMQKSQNTKSAKKMQKKNAKKCKKNAVKTLPR